MTDETETSKHITITIPDELYDRVQGVKDDLNISAACAEGLEIAVRKEEAKIKDGDEMDKLVEQLQIDMEQTQKVDKENGFSHGQKRAYKFRFADFKAIERIAEMVKRYGKGANIQEIVDSVMKDLNCDFMQLFWADDSEPGFTDRQAYLEGYIDGVMKLWAAASKKIKDKSQ